MVFALKRFDGAEVDLDVAPVLIGLPDNIVTFSEGKAALAEVERAVEEFEAEAEAEAAKGSDSAAAAPLEGHP